MYFSVVEGDECERSLLTSVDRQDLSNGVALPGFGIDLHVGQRLETIMYVVCLILQFR